MMTPMWHGAKPFVKFFVEGAMMLTDEELAAIEKMPGLAHAGGKCGCGECAGYLTAWELVASPLLAEVRREREAGFGERYVDALRATIREQADEVKRLRALIESFKNLCGGSLERIEDQALP